VGGLVGLVGSGHVRLYVETSNSGRFQKSAVSVIVVLPFTVRLGVCGEVDWRHCTNTIEVLET
jgi:hypothetical protein